MRFPLIPVAMLGSIICSLSVPWCLAETAPPSAKTAQPDSTLEKGIAEHVIIIVWDGMRPDFIRDDTTPALAKLAREGTLFANHHSIYPTSTEVNGTALATGCFPGHSGIIGNREYRPDIDPLNLVATESPSTMQKGDDVSHGKYLLVPTLPEILQSSGSRTVVAGTKPVAMLMDRSLRQLEPDGTRQSVIVVAGSASSKDVTEEIEKSQGTFPTDVHFPNTGEDAWTTGALIGTLWNDRLPKFSVLWLSEPDYSQHQFGIGSPTALRALAGSDAQLARVLATLDKNNWREKTDVLVVSDHGFSTIDRPVDVARELAAAGLTAHRAFKPDSRSGDILVDGLGGSVFLYVKDHDIPTVERATAVLQKSDFAGVIFTQHEMEGTFPLKAAHIDSAYAPDIVVALRWNDEKSAAGIPGTIISDGGRKTGQGTHATFGRFDVHNTFVAAGPDFRVGSVNDTPTSNVDLAPTVAWILGQTITSPVDGRVVREALVGAPSRTVAPPKTEHREASRNLDGKHWQQYLQTTYFDGETYLDEGNGTSVVAEP